MLIHYFYSLAIVITLYIILIGNSFSQTSDTIEIKATLKKGDFINTNLTFVEGNTICPDNNCISELQKTSFNEGFDGANSEYLSGTQIEDKTIHEFVESLIPKFTAAYGLTKQELEWLDNQRNEEQPLLSNNTGIEDFNIYNYTQEELEEAYLSIMSPLEKEAWIKTKYLEMLGEDYLRESDNVLQELERSTQELERSAQELENFDFN